MLPKLPHKPVLNGFLGLQMSQQHRLMVSLGEMHLHQALDLLAAFKTSGCTVRHSNIDAGCWFRGPVMQRQASGQQKRRCLHARNAIFDGCMQLLPIIHFGH